MGGWYTFIGAGVGTLRKRRITDSEENIDERKKISVVGRWCASGRVNRFSGGDVGTRLVRSDCVRHLG